MRPNQYRGRARSRTQWALAIDVLTRLRGRELPLRSELAKEAGIGTGTMTDLVTRLAGLRLVAERPAPVTGRGRPSTLLTVHPQGPLVALADIGAERWRTAMTGVDGRAEITASGTVRRDNAAATLVGIRAAVRAIADEHGGRVVGVAASVAGPLRGNTVVPSSSLFWDEVDLAEIACGLPLTCGNDATLAGLAEVRRGAARDAATAVHVLLLTGAGGALCIDGVPAVGATGAGGEFGHLPFGAPEALCACGALGCWNTVIGSTPLSRDDASEETGLAEVERVRTRLSALVGVDEPPADVLAALTSLARGSAGLVNALDPTVLTIGGIAIELRAVNPALFDEVYTAGLMRHRRAAPPPVLDATFGADGPLVGLIELALDAALTPPVLDAWAHAS
ncbi:MAG: ROK family protein [Dermatophilus congolensis]|nr:ROK family protein [Dermatophilus congolensis]